HCGPSDVVCRDSPLIRPNLPERGPANAQSITEFVWEVSSMTHRIVVGAFGALALLTAGIAAAESATVTNLKKEIAAMRAAEKARRPPAGLTDRRRRDLEDRDAACGFQ